VSWLPDSFELLATEIDALNPCYIPLDTDDRDDWIELINELYGLCMDPEGWPLIGHQDTHLDWVLSEEDMSLLKPVLTKHIQFFSRWYPDLIHDL